SQVGGDWYDAFVLPDGATALVIGDVVGHDLEAAADMAQLRNMLRAYAFSQQKPPSKIVEWLDQAAMQLSGS
ncbi:SpoIIE family protein phosphatase, partial [Streptomyces sp. SID6648]|nr:SpoIIE family protein phosphatase [Streptomyces sp. SID6648]